MQKTKPILAKRIFWDVNFDAIDYDEKWKFVIERVFDRGDIDDIRQVRRYYGDENTIVRASALDLFCHAFAKMASNRVLFMVNFNRSLPRSNYDGRRHYHPHYGRH